MNKLKPLTLSVVAAAAPSTLHPLRGAVEPVLAEWMRETSSIEQLLVGGTNIPGSADPHLTSARTASVTSSVVTAICSEPQLSSLCSANVPSLVQTEVTLSAWSTASTGSRSKSSVQSRGSVDSADPQTPVPDFQCAFYFIGCVESFTCPKGCAAHSLVHFRGHRPPLAVQCPFCIEWTTSGAGAWAARMAHVAEHQRNGSRLTQQCRPDYALYEHLRRIRVIDMMQYQELAQKHFCDVASQAFCEMNNPGRDRRNGVPGPARVYSR